jgi:hypothetical protein
VSRQSVSLDIRGDGVLTSESTGTGQGFNLEARSRLPMRVGRGFDVGVDTDAPLASEVTLTGRAEQVWALFGPEDQSMRGELQANMQAGGTPRPRRRSEGRRIRAGLLATGAFDQQRASRN